MAGAKLVKWEDVSNIRPMEYKDGRDKGIVTGQLDYRGTAGGRVGSRFWVLGFEVVKPCEVFPSWRMWHQDGHSSRQLVEFPSFAECQDFAESMAAKYSDKFKVNS